MSKLSLVSMAVALGAMVASPASAYEKSRTVTRGKLATLSASTSDECSSTFLYLYVADEVVKDGSGKTKTRTGFISYGGRDACLDATWGGTAQITSVDPLNLSSVSFTFAIDVQYAVYDQEPIQQKVVGTVRLDANGDAVKTRDSTVTIVGDQRTVARVKGNMRDATATINIKLDGKPVSFGDTVGTLGATTEASFEVTSF
jgi:hypothetical protein